MYAARAMRSFGDSTKSYENWMREHMDVLPGDLRIKRQRMSESSFVFLRGTFYRWAEWFPATCPVVAKCTAVLSVGDAHVENFGTWRDGEGRLAWGVNDFDEAYPLPWPNDLVRLMTSVRLAIRCEHLMVKARRAAAVLLDGYTSSLERGGTPFVLAEAHAWLRDVATSRLRDPKRFWRRLEALASERGGAQRPPLRIARALKASLPAGARDVRMFHRVAGVGSLGRPRWVALASMSGGLVAREAKAWLPSACAWVANQPCDTRYQSQLLTDSVRAADPMLHLESGLTVRRLSPDCARVELDVLETTRDREHLLFAMGAELANVHLATPRVARAILRDMKRLKGAWLDEAARAMEKIVLTEWLAGQPKRKRPARPRKAKN